MFPGMEDAVIEVCNRKFTPIYFFICINFLTIFSPFQAVLRSNQGAVDATIDQLLAMNTDYENEQLRHELDEADGSSDTPDLIQSVSAASTSAGACGGGSTGAVPDNISRLPRSPVHEYVDIFLMD